ncbi:MAG: arsenate reductase ArsC [Candidatus Competibacteraceae bacterium]|nr:arsenate reductase ArsC [Candidatus Competibacteraceae bacterium]
MHPVRVLFICDRNATRSQVAEALLRRLGGASVEVYSAGVQPEPFDLLAIEVMADMGIDISGQMGKSMEHFMDQDFDYIITLSNQCFDYADDFPGEPEQLHWHLPDPVDFQGDPQQRRWWLQQLYLELATRIRGWLAALPEDNLAIGESA